MALPIEYTIDHSRIEGDDQQCNARGRLIEHLQSREVLLEFLQALVTVKKSTYDAVIEMIRQRTIEGAAGVNLDVLGEIVGQRRVSLNQGDKDWFGMDHVTPGVGRMDTSTAWIRDFPIFADVVAGDEDYKQLIAAKAIKNTVRSCSVTEIQSFVRVAFGIECSVRRVGLRRVSIIVGPNTPRGTMETLRTLFITDRFDAGYVVPVLAGVTIVDVLTS